MKHNCPYCGHPCKTPRGQTQHINKNPNCKAAHSGTIGQGDFTVRVATNLQATRSPPGSPGVAFRRQSKRRRASTEEEGASTEEAEAKASVPEVHEGSGIGIDNDEFGYVGDEDSDAEDDEADVNLVDMEEGEAKQEEEPDHLAPNTQILEDFRQYCMSHSITFSDLDGPTIKSIKLMQVLRKNKSPLSAHQPFLEWHLKETGHLRDETMGLRDSSQYFTRETIMKRLFKRYNCESLKPVIKKVRLPFSKAVASIPCRNAKDVLVSLLTDPRIQDKDYLFFNDDPLAPPPNPAVHLEDLNTGESFLKSHEEWIKEKGEVLLPVVVYIDGAVTGQFSDLPITAVKLALGIHTREARDKEHAWRELGWIPQVRKQKARGKKLYQESKHLEAQEVVVMDGEGDYAEEQKDKEARDEEKEDDDEEAMVGAQDFHTMLSVILESFLELQRTGFVWDLVYKGKVYKKVRFVIFVPFIKCDTEEGDMLCGKYRVRTRNIKCICRYCKCPTDKADDPRLTYKMKTPRGIQKLIDRRDLEGLKQISQHSIRNAWHPVRFHAANLRGVHGACPSEMLHAILLGIFKYTRATFFEHMGETSKLAEDINGLAKMYGQLLTRQSDRSLPNTNFSKGIQKGKLMGKEYRGVLLVMAVLVRSTKGRQLMGKKMGGENGMTDWSVLVELLLEWEAYLCVKKMKKKDVKKLKRKHIFIMYMLRNVARRYKGMGLKIMKFHAIKHMVEDMLLYGTPSEFDTGSNESHHKSSKYAAKLTQRKEATFNFQTAMRMTEFLVLDLAMCEIEQGRCLWKYFGDDLEAPLEQIQAQLDEDLKLSLENQLYLDDPVDTNEDSDADAEGGEDDDREESDDEEEVGFRELTHKDSDSEDEDEDDEEEEQEEEVQEEQENKDKEPEPAADALEQAAPTTVVVTGGTKIRMDWDTEHGNAPSFTMLTRSKAMKATKKWNTEVMESFTSSKIWWLTAHPLTGYLCTPCRKGMTPFSTAIPITGTWAAGETGQLLIGDLRANFLATFGALLSLRACRQEGEGSNMAVFH